MSAVDQEHTKSGWRKLVQEAHELSQSAISHAESVRRFPKRCFILQSENGYKPGQAAQKDAHRAVMIYWSYIVPYKEKVAQKWQLQLGSVQVPKSQTVTVDTNLYGEPENVDEIYDRLQTIEQPICLETLAKYWRTESFLLTIKSRRGQVLERRSHRLYLPISHVLDVHLQLYSCAAELDIAEMPQNLGSNEGDAAFDYEDLLDNGDVKPDGEEVREE